MGPKDDSPAEKAFFTTGDAARICGVSHRTVVNYCNQGRIQAIQSPITRYRRIPRAALVAFMQTHGIPPVQLETYERLHSRRGARMQDRIPFPGNRLVPEPLATASKDPSKRSRRGTRSDASGPNR